MGGGDGGGGGAAAAGWWRPRGRAPGRWRLLLLFLPSAGAAPEAAAAAAEGAAAGGPAAAAPPGPAAQLRARAAAAAAAGARQGGEAEAPEARRRRHDCRCGDRGCGCDLGAAAELDALLLGLGYDRCVEEGECEQCREEEWGAGYCAVTGQRQRVVCAHCDSPHPPLPFCLPGLPVFWAANASRPTPNGGNASGGPSAGVFFRSCSGRPANASAEAAAGEQPPRSKGAAAAAVRAPAARGGTRAPPDESSAVLSFLAFMSLGLLLSVLSLRRQQRASLSETMQGLYSPVSNGPAPSSASAGPAVSPRPPGSPEPGAGAGAAAAARRASEAKERRSPVPVGGGGRDTAAAPDKFGRSMESLAEAVARTGSAIELAVSGQAAAGSEQKMK